MPPTNGARLAVAFVEYLPPYLGSDKRIFELTRRLPGWRVVHFVTPPLRALLGMCEPSLMAYLETKFVGDEGREGSEEDGQPASVYLRIPKVLHRLWCRIFYLAYPITVLFLLSRCVRLIATLRPSIVILGHPSYLCGLVGAFSARLLRIPVLLDYPDAWTPLACEIANVRSSSVLARVLMLIEKLVLRLAVGVTAVSDGVARYTYAVGAKSAVRVIPNGVDSQLFDPDWCDRDEIRRELGLGADEQVVLFSGRLDRWAGVDALVDKFAELCGAHSGAKLLIVGDGILRKALQNRRDGHEHVVLLSPRPHDEIPRIVAASDVGIVFFPLTDATEHCIPLKIMEYLALGKPVICTPLPGVRSLLDGAIKFSEDFRIENCLKSCQSLLEDAETRSRLTAGARDIAKRFDWSVLALSFAEAVNAVAEGSLSVERRRPALLRGNARRESRARFV